MVCTCFTTSQPNLISIHSSHIDRGSRPPDLTLMLYSQASKSGVHSQSSSSWLISRLLLFVASLLIVGIWEWKKRPSSSQVSLWQNDVHRSMSSSVQPILTIPIYDCYNSSFKFQSNCKALSSPPSLNKVNSQLLSHHIHTAQSPV